MKTSRALLLFVLGSISGLALGAVPAPARGEVLAEKPDLRAVAVHRKHAVAVGTGGAVYLYAPKTGWTASRTPGKMNLSAVAMISRRGIWAVADSGEAIHYDGEEWFSLPVDKDGGYFGVAMAGRNRGTAVGRDGRVFDLVEGRWLRIHAAPTRSTLRALAGIGRGTFIAVGDKGTIAAIRGVGRGLTVDLEMSPVKTDLRAVAGCARSRAEAVAAGGKVVLLRGGDGDWQRLADAPADITDLAVTCRRRRVTRIVATTAKGLLSYAVPKPDSGEKPTWQAHPLDGTPRALTWYRARKTLLVVGDAGLASFVAVDSLSPSEASK